jgi:hypothetical protein
VALSPGDLKPAGVLGLDADGGGYGGCEAGYRTLLDLKKVLCFVLIGWRHPCDAYEIQRTVHLTRRRRLATANFCLQYCKAVLFGHHITIQ